MRNDRPIGVFDSGVGGLTVLHAVAEALPGENLVYLGDTARVPYGPKSPDTVRRYAREAARFLRHHDVKMLVVACNTVSSVALDAVTAEAGVPVMGVIEPGARRASELSTSGRIGVIGTRTTVASQAYPRAIQALRPAARVISQACPLFVPLAEEGWTDNEVARATARHYLQPFRDGAVDTLVLGCTHYPLLRSVIAEVLGPSVLLVDSAESVAADVRASVEGSAAAGRRGTRRFFVTDAPEPFSAVASRFLGEPARAIEHVELEEEVGRH